MYAGLGHVTWFGFCNRPSLSCFHQIYSKTNTDGSFVLGIAGEVFLFLALLLWLEGGLTRRWQKHVRKIDNRIKSNLSLIHI